MITGKEILPSQMDKRETDREGKRVVTIYNDGEHSGAVMPGMSDLAQSGTFSSHILVHFGESLSLRLRSALKI